MTRLLFVDDILIFCEGSRRVIEKLKEIIEIFFIFCKKKEENLLKKTDKFFDLLVIVSRKK